jgi:hypothetical protein
VPEPGADRTHPATPPGVPAALEPLRQIQAAARAARSGPGRGNLGLPPHRAGSGARAEPGSDAARREAAARVSGHVLGAGGSRAARLLFETLLAEGTAAIAIDPEAEAHADAARGGGRPRFRDMSIRWTCRNLSGSASSAAMRSAAWAPTSRGGCTTSPGISRPTSIIGRRMPAAQTAMELSARPRSRRRNATYC